MLPSARLRSSFGRLLPSARLSTFDPLIPQIYTAPPSSQTRGDFGLKRPLASALASQPGRVRYVGVESLDVDGSGTTAWQEQEQRVLLRNSWLESGARLRRAGSNASSQSPRPRFLAATPGPPPVSLDGTPVIFGPQSSALGLAAPPPYRSAPQPDKRLLPAFSRRLDMRDDFCAMSPSAFQRYLREVRKQRPAWRDALKQDLVQRAREIAVTQYNAVLKRRRQDAEAKRSREANEAAAAPFVVANANANAASSAGLNALLASSSAAAAAPAAASLVATDEASSSAPLADDASAAAAAAAAAAVPASASSAVPQLSLSDIPQPDLSKLRHIDTWDASRAAGDDSASNHSAWFAWLQSRAAKRAKEPWSRRLFPLGAGAASSSHPGASAAAAPLHPFGGLQYGNADAIQSAILAPKLPGLVLCSSEFVESTANGNLNVNFNIDDRGRAGHEHKNNGYIVSFAGRMAQARTSHVSHRGAVDWAGGDAARAEIKYRIAGEATYGPPTRAARARMAAANNPNAPPAVSGPTKFTLLPAALGTIYSTVLPTAALAESKAVGVPGTRDWVGKKDGKASSRLVQDFASLRQTGLYGGAEKRNRVQLQRRKAARQGGSGWADTLSRLAKSGA